MHVPSLPWPDPGKLNEKKKSNLFICGTLLAPLNIVKTLIMRVYYCHKVFDHIKLYRLGQFSNYYKQDTLLLVFIILDLIINH